MSRVVLFLVLAVFSFQHSFAYIPPVLKHEHALKIKDINLEDDDNLDQYVNLLDQFIDEVKTTNFSTTNEEIENHEKKKEDYRNYLKTLQALKKIAKDPKSSLKKITASRDIFVKKHEKEKSLGSKVYDFFTSPVGLTLSFLVVSGALWFFKDQIINFFFPADSKALNQKQNDQTSEDLLDNNDQSENDDDLTYASDEKGQRIVDWDTRDWATKLTIKKGNISTLFSLRDLRGNDVLMWAAKKNKLKIIKALLKTKIAVNNQNHDKETALIIAIQETNNEAVKLLLKNQDINLGLKDSLQGMTAIGWAAYKGNDEVMKLLLNHPKMHSSLLEEKNKMNLIPYRIAYEKKFQNIVKLISQYLQKSYGELKLPIDNSGRRSWNKSVIENNFHLTNEHFKVLRKVSDNKLTALFWSIKDYMSHSSMYHGQKSFHEDNRKYYRIERLLASPYMTLELLNKKIGKTNETALMYAINNAGPDQDKPYKVAKLILNSRNMRKDILTAVNICKHNALMIAISRSEFKVARLILDSPYLTRDVLKGRRAFKKVGDIYHREFTSPLKLAKAKKNKILVALIKEKLSSLNFN